MGLLHVRGGVSDPGVLQAFLDLSSPRPWRCFLHALDLRQYVRVFSTSVEVFPPALACLTRKKSLLHVRGGVSVKDFGAKGDGVSSPRPWRCFHARRLEEDSGLVLSTSVEVLEHFGSWRDCCLLT